MLYVKQELLESGAAVAQVTVNHLVGGSNPSFPANISGRSSAWFRAPALGAGGPRFESLCPDQYPCRIMIVQRSPTPLAWV